MSGVESCPMGEPSKNSTIECTMLCGCTTTPTRAISMSNSQRASIISSPLLNNVAESIVILRPMTHDGCLIARSTVSSENFSFRSDVKQPARLDHFQPLVEQRRGINRDLAAHDP